MLSIIARLENDLCAIKECEQLRILCPPTGIDFCSSDYFSLAKHPHIINAVKQSLLQEGYGSTSSRFIRGERDSFQALEQRLAHFKRSEKAVLFSSGYAANIGVLSSLIKKGDMVFSDQLNHASIIDGLRLSGADICIYAHVSVDDLYQKISEAPKNAHKFLVTESLFSMDGDHAPLDRYVEMARELDLGLIVDEAHAVGLYGSEGSGLINYFGIEKDVLLSINGLGKAFGCYGAFVAGHKVAIDFVTQKARTLMFTTAPPPLNVAAIDAALDIVEKGDYLRQCLFNNIRTFADALKVSGFDVFHKKPSPIFPVIIKDNQKSKMIALLLAEAGFDVKAIRPPTVPKNSARLRITTNVSHSETLIKDFVKHLRMII